MSGLMAWMVLGAPALAQQTLQPGEEIQEALSAQITPAGFDAIEDLIEDLVPTLIPEDLLALDDIDLAGIGAIENISGSITVRGVEITPQTGRLVIQAGLNLRLGSPQDELYIELPLCDGNGWIGPVPIDISIGVGINVFQDQVTGEAVFDVDVTNQIDVQIDANQFNTDLWCEFAIGLLAQGLGDVLVSSLVQPLVNDAIADLEPTIAEALAQAKFVDSLELLDATVDISLQPKRVVINSQGMELIYRAATDAAPAACVEEFDPGSSPRTNTPLPGITENPAGTQVAAHVSDDMVNQVLYAAFRGGVLCYTVDANAGIDLPIPLDSGLLGLVGGEAYTSLVDGDAKPLVIKTRPKAAPTVSYNGSADIEAHVEQLGLDFLTEIDGRMARALALEVQADAGVNLVFDGTTGEVAVDVDLPPGAIVARVVPDVMVAGTEIAVGEAVTDIVDGLLGQLLTPLLGDLVFPLPAFEGLGVTALQLSPGGANQDWLTGQVNIGAVAYGSAEGGCNAEGGEGGCGGCDSGSSDCGGGCSASRRGTGPLALLAALWLLRRRR